MSARGVPTIQQLYEKARRDVDSEQSTVLSKLIRGGITTFDDLHAKCGRAPSRLQGIRGVGPKSCEKVCAICVEHCGPFEGGCHDENALAPATTIEGLWQRGKLTAPTASVVMDRHTTIRGVYEDCKGCADKFSAMCEGLSARGMQDLCRVCGEQLTGPTDICPYLLEREDLEGEAIPSVYINNIMRAFGVSEEAALWALRYGTSYK